MTALNLLTNELRSKGSKTQYVSVRQGFLYLGLRGLCTYAHAHVGESMNFPEREENGPRARPGWAETSCPSPEGMCPAPPQPPQVLRALTPLRGQQC